MAPPDHSIIGTDGWNEWSRHVLAELSRLTICYEKLDEKVGKVNDKMTMLQIKVAGIGAGASIIVTLVILLLSNVLRR